MSSRRAERLVNLVICLLATRQYLTAARIRETVPGYDRGDDELSKQAFQRMFERDKTELRELGIPLETGTNSIFDTEADIGYRIARREYELPDIHLDPDEAAAVGLAARLWQSGLAAAASSALVKLRAAGVEVDPQTTLGIEPIVDATEPALGGCLDAVRAGRVVRFRYRSARADAPESREVEPWGVVSWHGRWYLVGHDRQRAATRVFRLSRVAGPVVPVGSPGVARAPDGLDLVAQVAAVADRETAGLTARIRVRNGRGAGLRRLAGTALPGQPYDVVELPFGDVESLADRLVGYGADIVVDGPRELRAAVVDRLRALAGTPS